MFTNGLESANSEPIFDSRGDIYIVRPLAPFFILATARPVRRGILFTRIR